MKYLKIQNNGELDIRLIALMGGTTKADDPKKIGQFGTGLKYAISYFMRNGIDLKVFVGEEEVSFKVESKEIQSVVFNEIYMNDVSMNITTRYGYQWEAWEAIREIWCNAKDEGGSSATTVDTCSGLKNKTTFFIQINEEVKKVVDDWDNYFLKAKPISFTDKVSIYKNEGEFLKIYKGGVLVHTDKHEKSLFNYDFKDGELNELRQYRGHINSQISKALLDSNKNVIKQLISAIKDPGKSKMYEVKNDWSNLWLIDYNRAKVKEIFQGYLFIDPSSEEPKGERTVKVNQGLFNLLLDCDLPCERIRKAYASSFGSGGYSSSSNVQFKEVSNDKLTFSIGKILKQYNSEDIDFTIAVPVSKDFEMIINFNTVVFSADLENFSNSDLEAVVLVAIFHKTEGNMYKAFKRMIKTCKQNKNFDSILFGR